MALENWIPAREYPQLDMNQLRKQLPKIGEVVFQTPKTLVNEKYITEEHPRVGVVTYVNEEHLWFQIQFQGTYGVLIKECWYPYEKLNIVGHIDDDPRTWRIKHE